MTMMQAMASLLLWFLVATRLFGKAHQQQQLFHRHDGGDNILQESTMAWMENYNESSSQWQSDSTLPSCQNNYEGICQVIVGIDEDHDEDVLYSEFEVDFDEDDEYEEEEDNNDEYEEEEHDQKKEEERKEEEYDPLQDLGVEQRLVSSSNYGSLTRTGFEMKLQEMNEYKLSLTKDPALSKILRRCKNLHKDCAMGAMLGWCEEQEQHHRNQKSLRPWMLENCPLSCQECDKLLYEHRCPYDINSPKAWEDPNGLNQMFERIISEPRFKKYNPKVWSRPRWAEPNPDFYDTPWVVSLDNFISDEEVERLLEIASLHGYKRSDEGGKYLEDGTFVTFEVDFRTSYNSWCTQCYKDRLGKAVLKRIEDVTRIHRNNYNYLQMLRYTEGQKYESHHDFDYYSVPRQPGPRILTVFIYLNEPEEGGQTNFPYLGLTFKPKKGRVVIWPNVLNEDPFEWDPMTKHQALPVIKGVKYAANAWIHMHDFQGPHKQNCDS